jgi:hypothetical protein
MVEANLAALLAFFMAFSRATCHKSKFEFGELLTEVCRSSLNASRFHRDQYERHVTNRMPNSAQTGVINDDIGSKYQIRIVCYDIFTLPQAEKIDEKLK